MQNVVRGQTESLKNVGGGRKYIRCINFQNSRGARSPLGGAKA